MTAELWEVWAEMSITHRDVHDADVAAVLHLIQREAELRREEAARGPSAALGE
jgi:hypothetical protein